MTRVAIWAAVSSEEQARDDKTSIPNQLTAGEAWATANGGQVVARYVVPGHTREPYVEYSQAAGAMPAYADLKRDLDKRALDVLWARSLDRLGRNAALIHQVVLYCQRAGVRLVLENLPLTGNAVADNYLIGLGGATAGNELAEFRRRNRDGMNDRAARRGLPVSTWLPFPYYRLPNPETGRPSGPAHLDPRKAEALREVYRLVITGHNLMHCARYLNALGLYTARGNPWNRRSLQIMLLNPFLMGRVVRHAVRAGKQGETRWVRLPEEQWINGLGKHEPIFTPEEFAELERRIRPRDPGRPSVSGRALWTGIMRCGYCDSRMTPTVSSSATKGGYVGYYCLGYPLLKCSHRNHLPQSRATPQILALLEELLGLADDTAPVVAPPLTVDHSDELAGLAQREKRLLLLYESGRITLEQYDERAVELSAQRALLEEDVNKALSLQQQEAEARRRRAQLRDLLPDLPAYLASADPREANALLRQIVPPLSVMDGVITLRKQ